MKPSQISEMHNSNDHNREVQEANRIAKILQSAGIHVGDIDDKPYHQAFVITSRDGMTTLRQIASVIQSANIGYKQRDAKYLYSTGRVQFWNKDISHTVQAGPKDKQWPMEFTVRIQGDRLIGTVNFATANW